MEFVHFTRNSQLTNYFPVPRAILERSLPYTAVVLYGILLDRGTLSQKNGYVDSSDWIYVVYPILELTEVLGISTTSVKKNLKILEEAGLICRIRRRRSEANRIYLMVPPDSLTATGTDTGKDAKCTSEGRKSPFRRERKVPPSNIRKQQEISNVYQHNQEESL